MRAPAKDSIQVWDLFVRASHWLIAIGFFVAYFTEEDHFLKGAFVLALIAFGIFSHNAIYRSGLLRLSDERR